MEINVIGLVNVVYTNVTKHKNEFTKTKMMMKKLQLLLIGLILTMLSFGQDTEEITVSKQLYSGWNLIGYHGTANLPIDSALSQIWEYVDAVKCMDAFYIEGYLDEFNLLDSLKQGEGYLVSVSEDCMLEWTILRYNYPPQAPVAIFPVNGSSEVDTSFYLKWQSSDSENEVLTYRVLMDGNNPPEAEIPTDSELDSVLVSNLEHGSTYYWLVVAQDEFGHGVQSEVFSYSTIASEDTVGCTLTDIDGNTYPCVQIGEQVWMAQNLRVTRYADGTAIPHLQTATDWDTLRETGKAFCWYDTTGTNYTQYTKETFGALFTWAAATNGNTDTVGVQGACPNGWHLPSYDEWLQLERYLAESGYAYDDTGYDGTERDYDLSSKIAKSLASDWGWYSSSHVGAVGNMDYPTKRNSSRFSVLPAGVRPEYNFGGLGDYASYWSSTQSIQQNINGALIIDFYSQYARVYNAFTIKEEGRSIRCLKDY